MLTILGIGRGDLASLTMEGFSRIEAGGQVVLQTGHIPLAEELTRRGIAFETLDACYDAAEDFDELQEFAVQYFQRRPDALFCVMGDLSMNTLVRALLQNGPAELVAGYSPSAAALSLCAAELSGSVAQSCSAYDFLESEYSGQGSLVITEVDSPYLAAEVALRLQRYFSGDWTAYVVRGTDKRACAISELCTWPDWDFSCVIVVPEQSLTAREGYTFADFCRILDILLGENGCPWDRAQTHESLRTCLLEECYEVVEAIDEKDSFQLADELGDLLMQVCIHAKIAEKHGEFDALDVSTEISRKMIRRHPNIFGSGDGAESWEELKRREKPWESYAAALSDIPRAMSALLRAAKLHRKADSLHVTPAGAEEAAARIPGEFAALLGAPAEVAERLAGEVLFDLTQVLGARGVDAEAALQQACSRFVEAISRMEALAWAEGADPANMPAEARKMLWQRANCAKSL